jgi:hypothetical protein
MKLPHFIMGAMGVSIALASAVHPAGAASLSRSVEVRGSAAEVWSKIGPFCAIADWHPAIGSCTAGHGQPPVRTLVTKDGKATFVEVQTARSERSYSYAFRSAPIPVTHYRSTIKVVGKADGTSTVSWRGDYTPDKGRADAANAALAGIYESGLDAIKATFAR